MSKVKLFVVPIIKLFDCHKEIAHFDIERIFASRSLYTLAVIIIKFKNTKNHIPNSIR